MSINLKIELFKIFRLEFSVTSGNNKKEEIANDKSNNLDNTSSDGSKPKR